MPNGNQKNNEDFYVAEWSPRQRQFHVETVKGMIKTNRRIMAKGTLADYFPFAICATYEEAHQACDDAEKLLTKRKKE